MPVLFAQARRFLRLAITQHSGWHQREPFLTPNRGKVELIGWGRARQTCAGRFSPLTT